MGKKDFLRTPLLPCIAMQENNNGIENKNPSNELLNLINAAAKGLEAFGTLWQSIKEKGAQEGFTETDLQNMLKPLLRDQLGMDKNKIYYLFHAEQVKDKQKERDQSRKIQQIAAKNDMEQSDTPPNTNPPEGPGDEPEPEDPEIQELAAKYGVVETATIPEGSVPLIEPPTVKKVDRWDLAHKSLKQQLQDSLDFAPPFQVATHDIETTSKVVMRELAKVKGWGWKVVEINIRVVS